MQTQQNNNTRDPGFIWRAINFLPLAGKCENTVMDEVVVFGMLGASKVGSYALIWPSKRSKQTVVGAIAARKSGNAQNYANKHKIAGFYEGYNGVIENDQMDVIYNGLPNALHGQWSKKALEAGKHVLCEKPFAANEQEAKQVQQVAKQKKRLCIEAFHYSYHPLFQKIQDMVKKGEIGDVKQIHTTFKRPFWCSVFTTKDIRMDYGLAGGATMDLDVIASMQQDILVSVLVQAQLRQKLPNHKIWIQLIQI
eukprot:TRINITY_DN9992_c0_g3_i1.p1 TRINITY_DN9992_c0_g3~~TRINITY_DN9992_c0_g3_i1.p1  ORF type:complete len:252 (+),score=26.96 TRINITY_DN9992_c0_g3_i1:114-869(+)